MKKCLIIANSFKENAGLLGNEISVFLKKGLQFAGQSVTIVKLLKIRSFYMTEKKSAQKFLILIFQAMILL